MVSLVMGAPHLENSTRINALRLPVRSILGDSLLPLLMGARYSFKVFHFGRDMDELNILDEQLYCEEEYPLQVS